MSKSYPETIPAEYAEYADDYANGWNHGHGIACHTVPQIGDKIDLCVDWVGLGPYVNAENMREYHELLCFAAEENSRQFTPFEYTAHDLNTNEGEDAEWIAEARWEAFEAGTTDAIRADIASYTSEDYGIETEGAA